MRGGKQKRVKLNKIIRLFYSKIYENQGLTEMGGVTIMTNLLERTELK